jgi:hypothetical protein
MTTVTSRNTGNEYNTEDLDKANGTIEHGGTTLHLLEQAVADNYGTDGLIRYYARAIDAEGTEYRIAWDTTDEWDLANEFERLMAESNPNDDQIARIEELADMVLPDVNDESNACDWDAPVSVKVY